MATSTPTSPPNPHPRRTTAPREYSRRTIILSALALGLLLLGGVVVVALTTDEGSSADRRTRAAEQDARPGSIPQPGAGRAPENAADRGGAEQLALFGLMLGGLAAIGLVIFRGGRKARTGRQQWAAAAASGHDGAVDGRGHLIDSDRSPPDPT